MALKFMLEKLDEVEEGLRKLYVEQEGKFYLDVDGVVSKDKLAEFRDKNISLMKAIDKYKILTEDPEKVQELVNEFNTLRKTKGKVSDKEINDLVEEKVVQRVAQMKEEHRVALQTETDKTGVLTRQLEGLLIDSAIRSEAGKLGVRAAAVDDVLLRARAVFKVQDGAAVPFDKKGSIIYGKDASTPMSAGEWITNLKKDAAHLFEDSQGGGARPGAGGKPGAAASDANKNSMSSVSKIAAGLAQNQM